MRCGYGHASKKDNMKLQKLHKFFCVDFDWRVPWQIFSAQRESFSATSWQRQKTRLRKNRSLPNLWRAWIRKRTCVYAHNTPKVENTHVFPIQNQKDHGTAHVFPITKYKTHGNAHVFPHSKHPVAWKDAMYIKCVSTSTMIIPIFSETLNVFPLQIGNARVFPPKNRNMIHMTWKRVCVSIFEPAHMMKRGCVSIREAGHIRKRVCDRMCIKCVSLCFLYNCTYCWKRYGYVLTMKTLYFAAKNARYSRAKQRNCRNQTML